MCHCCKTSTLWTFHRSSCNKICTMTDFHSFSIALPPLVYCNLYYNLLFVWSEHIELCMSICLHVFSPTSLDASWLQVAWKTDFILSYISPPVLFWTLHLKTSFKWTCITSKYVTLIENIFQFNLYWWNRRRKWSQYGVVIAVTRMVGWYGVSKSRRHLFSKMSTPAVGPFQPPIWWVPGFFPRKVARAWSWSLATIYCQG